MSDLPLSLFPLSVKGPGLEGHCYPSVCSSIIDDTLSIAIDPLLELAGGDGGENRFRSSAHDTRDNDVPSSHSEVPDDGASVEEYRYTSEPHVCPCISTSSSYVTSQHLLSRLDTQEHNYVGTSSSGGGASPSSDGLNGYHLLHCEGPSEGGGGERRRRGEKPILYSNALVDHVTHVMRRENV